MERSAGFLCALWAAIFFGVQYVPVKKYEIFDGTTFQWFMCAGILLVGFLAAIAFGDFGLSSKDSLLIVFGGAIWALSNYLVLPLVKLLGIGLGFSLYHFVNLIVGYVVGRFGLFGMQRLQGSLFMCDFGCFLVLLSFIVMVLVEAEDEEEIEDWEDVQNINDVDEEYREQYLRWRLGGRAFHRPSTIQDAMDTVGELMADFSPAECAGSNWTRVGGFSVLAAPRKSGMRSSAHVMPSLRPNGSHDSLPRSVSEPGGYPAGRRSKTASGGPVTYKTKAIAPLLTVDKVPSKSEVSPRSLVSPTSASKDALLQKLPQSWQSIGPKLLGVGIALLAGGFAGVQSVPAALYNEKHPHANPTAVVFPQCLGIYICSSLVYIFYSGVSKLSGTKVPHSPIGPAYFSGCLWGLGFSFMICGVSTLGFSVGYTLDAVGPIVVASLLSIFYFKEITERRQLQLYALAFMLQLCGVILMTVFGKPS